MSAIFENVCKTESIHSEPRQNGNKINAREIFERLHSTQTVSSMGKFYSKDKRSKDSLDYILKSHYNHSKEVFPDKVDAYILNDTICDPSLQKYADNQTASRHDKLHLHPLRYGGISNRRSPHNIKLMNSGHHSAKTAPGFSRQPEGGTIYFY